MHHLQTPISCWAKNLLIPPHYSLAPPLSLPTDTTIIHTITLNNNTTPLSTDLPHHTTCYYTSYSHYPAHHSLLLTHHLFTCFAPRIIHFLVIIWTIQHTSIPVVQTWKLGAKYLNTKWRLPWWAIQSQGSNGAFISHSDQYRDYVDTSTFALLNWYP